ncbi:MAG: dihydropteroate synthase [Chitinophagaceae bacterium]
MFTLNCKGRLLVVDKPIVMGIINNTPDSFYEGSRFETEAAILKQAEKLVKEGAILLDIGAQSTRPLSKRIDEEEELRRLIPGIQAIQQNFPEAILSVDTYFSKVAKEAVMAGASIVNDISAGNFDQQMIDTVSSLKVPFVCMHLKGTPETIHQPVNYENITLEVLDFFIQKIEQCSKAGILDIVIDPGFGFSKSIAHNFQLLKNLPALEILQKPILLGISRKSTIYKTLGITAAEALNGTTVLNSIGVLNGASILRVHDVKEAMETIKLISDYQSS